MSFLLNHIAGIILTKAMFLQIMQMIGFVLLILLIVVIALILCVLFFPVCYRAKGDVEKMDFAVKVQWLFHIVMFRASYKEETPDYALYLFGIRTRILDEDASKRRKNKRQKRKARKAAKKYNTRKKNYQKKHDKYKEQFLKENPLQEEVPMDSKEEYKVKQSEDSISKEGFSKEDNRQNSEKEKKQASKVIEVLKRVVHIIKTIAEHRPIQLLWPDIKKILYRARPRKINADITFGFEDPALTGKIIGAISNIYYLYQFDKLYINGDFEAEEAYVEGTFDVKGHLQAIFGIIFAIRIFRKKQFRNFMKALKL